MVKPMNNTFLLLKIEIGHHYYSKNEWQSG